MGAGKSTVAQSLAEKTGFPLVDADQFLETRENRSIREIIERAGERAFRELETAALREILQTGESKIVALGGGAWTIEENRQLISQLGCQTVWLDTPFELCWERIAENQENRPLAKNREAAQKLFNARREIYQTAEFRVFVTKQKSPAALADKILRLVSQLAES